MRKIDVNLPGVYQIKCLSNKRRYIGQSNNILLRTAAHIAALNRSTHPNQAMQADWNQYGAGCFEFAIIARLDCPLARLELEAELINPRRGADDIYNSRLRQRGVPAKSPTRKKKPAKSPSSPFAPIRFSDVRMIPLEDFPKLLTMSDAARQLGVSINTFKYHITKPNAPLALAISEGRIPYWYKADIIAWNPAVRKSAKRLQLGA